MDRTVLIVDDDPLAAASAGKAVYELGYRAILAEGEEDLVELLRENRPDLVLLDVDTGDGDGRNLFSRIRSLSIGRTPLLIVTSRRMSADYQLERLAEEKGAAGWLRKPYGHQILRRRLRNHLDARSRERSSSLAVSSLGPASGTDGSGPSEASRLDPEGVRSLLRTVLAEIPSEPSLRRDPAVIALSELHEARRTGVLYVSDMGDRIAFYLEAGAPVLARTSIAGRRLSRILFSRRQLRGSDYAQARDMVQRFGGARWLEEILLNLSHVGAAELQRTLRNQLDGLLRLVVSRSRPGTCFIEGEIPIPGEIRVEADLRPILFQGLKEIKDPELLQRLLPPADTVLAKAPCCGDASRALGLSRMEEEVLSLADGSRTCWEVRSIGLRTLGHVDGILLALVSSGLLTTPKRSLPTDSAAPPPCAGGKEVTGDLSRTSFAALLEFLHREAKTGVLVMERDREKKWIHWNAGEIVFARSNVPGDRIGRVLVEASLVGEAEVERAAGESGPGKRKRLGGVLMDRGLVTFDQLYWAGVFQVQRIVLGVAAWNEGTFLFREGPLPEHLKVPLPIETAPLIQEVREAAEALPRKTAALRPETLLRKAAGADERLRSQEQDPLIEGILAWMSGTMSLGEIFEVGLAGESEVRAAVAALLDEGLLEAVSGDESSGSGSPKRAAS